MHLEHFLTHQAQPITLAPGDVLVRQGQPSPPLHFLQSGLLKACYLTVEGKQSIKSFIQDSSLVGCLDLSGEDQASTFSIVALEPSRLLRFSLADLRAATQTDLALANEIIERLLKLARFKEKREREFLTMSAAERFALLRVEAPSILQRVTQNDIASYLGITPVGLSRIKGRANKGA